MAEGRELTYAEWKEMPTPDVYFTPEYHATSGLAEPDFSRSVLLEWTDHHGVVYLPLMLRHIRETDYFDAVSAYGYGGPWTQGDPDLSLFSEYLDQWASDNRVVSTFIRFHPLLENAIGFQAVWPMKLIGPTAVWNIAQSSDLVQGMAKNHRKNWRRAIRAGVHARVTRSPDNIDGFRDLYEETMERLSARSSYWLNDEYWGSLRDNLSDRSLLVEAVFEDRVIAAAWCLLSDEYLHYHLSGTTDEGRSLGGAYVCRVEAANWAKTAGVSLAHHGGGVSGSNSSLLDWKRKFDESASLRQFYAAELIHSKRLFNDFSEGHPRNGYFPPWRDPATNVVSL